ncbi:MAG: hypothetical protein R2699_05655 [Acidimicrobiales bacterium]
MSRFGLRTVEREHGVKFGELDALGDDSVAAYRALADGLRAGDRSVLAERR